MSKRFHINENGVASPCNAKIRCKLKSNSPHFETEIEAYAYYEDEMSRKTTPVPMKKVRESREEKTAAHIQEIQSCVEKIGVRANGLASLHVITSRWSKEEVEMLSELLEIATDATENKVPPDLMQKTSSYLAVEKTMTPRERLMLIDMEMLVNRQKESKKFEESVSMVM